MYKCECGRIFEKSQSFIGHCGHCEIHLGHPPADNFGDSRYKPRKKKNTKGEQCKLCGKHINNKNKSGFCQDCMRMERKKEKIVHWLETGDMGLSVGTTIRGCFREYIAQEQHDQCAICGLNNVWNSKELVFILDHIDGDASNNKRENLRLICPNCDSQLPTYKSKNKNSARSHRRKS